MPRPTFGLAVDGSCRNNPGPIQWQVTDLSTGDIIYTSRLYTGGTNNIAEYLAIVYALSSTPNALFPIYSDSQTARAWIKKGYCLPTLAHPDGEAKGLIIRANTFLKENMHLISRVETWNTREWGENAADFGFKNSR